MTDHSTFTGSLVHGMEETDRLDGILETLLLREVYIVSPNIEGTMFDAKKFLIDISALMMVYGSLLMYVDYDSVPQSLKDFVCEFYTPQEAR